MRRQLRRRPITPLITTWKLPLLLHNMVMSTAAIMCLSRYQILLGVLQGNHVRQRDNFQNVANFFN